MGIENALREIRQRIHAAAARVHRDPAGIRLVAVSKTVTLNKIIEAAEAGVHVFGENRVQEAREKIRQYTGYHDRHPGFPDAEWHLIGNLQKNKARNAVELFELIHSVDSVSLAEELDRQAAKRNMIQRVLVQVKLSDETAKHGVPEKDLVVLVDRIAKLENLKAEGLMTIPPFFDNPDKSRPYYKKLKQLSDNLSTKGVVGPELSMGMTNDFETAIEEGATMVRVGTAIFGERHYGRAEVLK